MALGFGKNKSGVVDAPPMTNPTLEKYGSDSTPPYDSEAQQTTGRKMGRIDGPITKPINGAEVSDDDASTSIGKQIEMEAGNAIKYRTCSWYKTAALLFSEYICLAIMSFPYSYSVLGLVPGLILTVVVAALVLYTSLIVWYVQLSW